MVLSRKAKKAISAGALGLVTAFALYIIDGEINGLRASLLNGGGRRSLSVDLGDGDCVYKPPQPRVSPKVKFHKYLLAGFPSGDKRMIYIQMEALTGLPSKDDWDFVVNGYSNAPFIKTNYPHPAGTWSWGSEADEVALVVQFIRRSLVEYADVVWYQSGARSYEAEREQVEKKYGERLDTNEWYKWRDERVLQEIYRYGSYIDYWMENGLRRDPISHRVIDQNMWEVLTNPLPLNLVDDVHICHKTSSPTNPAIDMVVSSKQAQVYIDHGDYLGMCADAQQDKSWWERAPPVYAANRDPRCQTITRTCSPRIVISSDKLRDYTLGPIETYLIGRRLNMTMPERLIDEATWPCIWKKIIHENRGPMTFDDRKLSEDPNFSAFMLEEMIGELNRLITKYSSYPWTSTNYKAIRLVSLFTEHVALLETELEEVKSGARALSVTDYLGPKDRTGISMDTRSKRLKTKRLAAK
ncbi:hypothetical protein HJC23_011947 [Cyclotella cryptica]|uniref:Uncharacterized protein n=1 Tax=Cyclotella cryptica TaxID=29204 RepID=A0ABD3QQC5_9STRA|eukprot:CCRYP_002996-RA/>CCRYP_002996-RA protein AED:0.04 eAED:0.04 QI:266/1/1/1/1/1/3/79/468